MQRVLQEQAGLTIVAGSVEDLAVEISTNGRTRVAGVTLADGQTLKAGAVVVTTGTFLRGQIYCGEHSYPAGRKGDAPAVGLAQTFDRCGFKLGRLRTGTPPRIDGRTINYGELLQQDSDWPPLPFSFMNDTVRNLDQLVKCHLTHTTERTHQIIRDNLHRSRYLDSTSFGPRYCPSLEAKVVRFSHRPRHQIWLEPEGLTTVSCRRQFCSVV